MDWTGDPLDMSEAFAALARDPPQGLPLGEGGCVLQYGFGLRHVTDYFSGVVLFRSPVPRKLGEIDDFRVEGRSRVWDVSMLIVERSSQKEAYEMWKRSSRSEPFDRTGYWYRVQID